MLALAGIAVVVAVVLVVRWRGGNAHHKADTSSVHATGIDQTDTAASMAAMLEAPEGATPCETAFAAVDAERSAAKLRGAKSIFQWVAPQADFLAQCQTLSPETQKCMMPRYRRDHRDDCLHARPPPDVLAKIIAGAPVPEPTREP